MSPLYKRLRENTAIFWIQSGGNRLPAKKSFNTNLHFLRNTLWPWIIQSTRLWRMCGNSSGSGGGSSSRSDMTCHKCGKNIHLKKDCRSKVNGSGGNPPKNYTNELPVWVTKKPVVSYTKYLKTATMTCNNKKYKWCTSCNNGQGAWGFHWKDGH